jgi:hypothetical protein
MTKENDKNKNEIKYTTLTKFFKIYICEKKKMSRERERAKKAVVA